MGRAISKIKNPLRDFNLENRAHKLISKPDKQAAPKHPKDQEDLNRIKKEYNASFQESLKKNETLDKHLKDVFVVSHDKPIDEFMPKIESKRPLPQDRSQKIDFLFGHKEPDNIPLGKTTLRKALLFISKHQEDPKNYSAEVIAHEHNLPLKLVNNILEYYKVFQVYVPEVQSTTKATFAGPSRKPAFQFKDEPKVLPSKFKKGNDDT
ncbi:hypothetical protein ABEB36_012399 [Hypothenemus hampei]|uniref:NDUFAF4-like protein n=1 Tax=Hypothenemus hampei TaxID=57062 RepID=A0ABD1EBC9_HYPHA